MNRLKRYKQSLGLGLFVFQELSVDDEGVVRDGALAPEVRGVVFVGSLDGRESSLDEVASSSSRSLSFCVNVVDTSEVEQLLGDGRGDQASSSGSRDQSNLD